jgi:archaellum component FlaC
MSGLDAYRQQQEEKARIREAIHARIDELVRFSFEQKAKSKGEKYASTHEFFGVAFEEMEEIKENYKCVKSLFKILCKDLRTLPDKEMAFRDQVKHLDVYLMLLIEEAVDLRVCCSKFLNRF